MAADKHYATDVLVGMAVGALFGFAIPMAFHPRDGRLVPSADTSGGGVQLELVPGPNGAALVGRF